MIKAYLSTNDTKLNDGAIKQGSAWSRKYEWLETAIFQLFSLVSDRSQTNFFVILAQCVTVTLQYVHFLSNDYSLFKWDSSVSTVFINIARAVSRFPVSEGSLSAFWVSVALPLFWVAVAALAIPLHRLSNWPRLLSCLHLCLRWLPSVLFIPIVRHLFEMFFGCISVPASLAHTHPFYPSLQCWGVLHIGYSIIAITTSTLFCLCSIATMYCFYDDTLPSKLNASHSASARSTNIHEVIEIIGKIILLILFISGRTHQWTYALPFAFCLLPATLLLFHLQYLPMQEDRTQFLYLARAAIALWTGLCALALISLEDSEAHGMLYFVGLPLAIGGSLLAIRARYTHVTHLAEHELTAPRQILLVAQATMRTFYRRLWAIGDVYLEGSPELLDAQNRMICEVERVLAFGTARFPQDVALRLFSATFQAQIKQNRVLAYIELQAAETAYADFGQRFFLFLLRQKLDLLACMANSSDIQLYLRFKEGKERADTDLTAAVSHLVQFWTLLRGVNAAVDELAVLGHSARKHLSKALDGYEELLQLNRRSIPLLRMFGMVLLDVVGDNQRAVAMYQAAEEVKHATYIHEQVQRSYLQQLDTNLDIDDRNAIFTISVDRASMGIIESANTTAQRLFGYPSESSLRNRNVNIIVPQPMARHHDQFIIDYITRRTSMLVSRTRMVYALHALGHLIPVNLYIKWLDEAKGKFVGVMSPVYGPAQQKDVTAIMDPVTKTLTYTTANFYACFGIPRRSVLAQEVQLYEVLPALTEADRADECYERMLGKEGWVTEAPHQLTGRQLRVHVVGLCQRVYEEEVIYVRMTVEDVPADDSEDSDWELQGPDLMYTVRYGDLLDEAVVIADANYTSTHTSTRAHAFASVSAAASAARAAGPATSGPTLTTTPTSAPTSALGLAPILASAPTPMATLTPMAASAPTGSLSGLSGLTGLTSHSNLGDLYSPHGQSGLAGVSALSTPINTALNTASNTTLGTYTQATLTGAQAEPGGRLQVPALSTATSLPATRTRAAHHRAVLGDDEADPSPYLHPHPHSHNHTQTHTQTQRQVHARMQAQARVPVQVEARSLGDYSDSDRYSTTDNTNASQTAAIDTGEGEEDTSLHGAAGAGTSAAGAASQSPSSRVAQLDTLGYMRARKHPLHVRLLHATRNENDATARRIRSMTTFANVIFLFVVAIAVIAYVLTKYFLEETSTLMGATTTSTMRAFYTVDAALHMRSYMLLLNAPWMAPFYYREHVFADDSYSSVLEGLRVRAQWALERNSAATASVSEVGHRTARQRVLDVTPSIPTTISVAAKAHHFPMSVHETMLTFNAEGYALLDSPSMNAKAAAHYFIIANALTNIRAGVYEYSAEIRKGLEANHQTLMLMLIILMVLCFSGLGALLVLFILPAIVHVERSKHRVLGILLDIPQPVAHRIRRKLLGVLRAARAVTEDGEDRGRSTALHVEIEDEHSEEYEEVEERHGAKEPSDNETEHDALFQRYMRRTSKAGQQLNLLPTSTHSAGAGRDLGAHKTTRPVPMGIQRLQTSRSGDPLLSPTILSSSAASSTPVSTPSPTSSTSTSRSIDASSSKPIYTSPGLLHTSSGSASTSDGPNDVSSSSAAAAPVDASSVSAASESTLAESGAVGAATPAHMSAADAPSPNAHAVAAPAAESGDKHHAQASCNPINASRHNNASTHQPDTDKFSALRNRTIRVVLAKYLFCAALVGLYFGVMFSQTVVYTGLIEQSALALDLATRRLPAILFTFFTVREFIFFDFMTQSITQPEDPVLRIGRFDLNIYNGIVEARTLHFAVVFGADELKPPTHSDRQRHILFQNSCAGSPEEFDEAGVHTDPFFWERCETVESGLLSHGMYAALMDLAESLFLFLHPLYSGVLNHKLQDPSAPPPVGREAAAAMAWKRLRELDTLISDYLEPIILFSTSVFHTSANAQVEAFNNIYAIILVVFLAGVLLAQLLVIRPIGALLQTTVSHSQAMLLLLPPGSCTSKALHVYIHHHSTQHE